MDWIHLALDRDQWRDGTQLGRPRRRWVDNIKMDLRDRMGWYGLD
jgi:hypothetical protein